MVKGWSLGILSSQGRSAYKKRKAVCCLGLQPRVDKVSDPQSFPGCGRHTIGANGPGHETVKGWSSCKKKGYKQGGVQSRMLASCMQLADAVNLNWRLSNSARHRNALRRPNISCWPLDSAEMVGAMSESSRVEEADPGCITKSSELYGRLEWRGKCTFQAGTSI